MIFYSIFKCLILQSPTSAILPTTTSPTSPLYLFIIRKGEVYVHSLRFCDPESHDLTPYFCTSKPFTIQVTSSFVVMSDKINACSVYTQVRLEFLVPNRPDGMSESLEDKNIFPPISA